jgi:hypothetical protein
MILIINPVGYLSYECLAALSNLRPGRYWMILNEILDPKSGSSTIHCGSTHRRIYLSWVNLSQGWLSVEPIYLDFIKTKFSLRRFFYNYTQFSCPALSCKWRPFEKYTTKVKTLAYASCAISPIWHYYDESTSDESFFSQLSCKNNQMSFGVASPSFKQTKQYLGISFDFEQNRHLHT